jgi:hypothetical protein
MVRKLRGSIDPIDSTTNARSTALQLKNGFLPQAPVRHIKIINDQVRISPQLTRYFTIMGTYNGTVAIKTHNRLPELQSAYAQGRSDNGTLVWRGPETGELFSYGPALHSLEYDGSNYPYDPHGKLVPAGTGNGQQASGYDNSIFRTAITHAHLLKLRTALIRYGKRTWNLDLKLGKSNEDNIVRENKSSSGTFGADLGTAVKWLTVKGSYLYSQQQRSTANRNGLLNRAYQYAMLTPASFNNAGDYTIGNGQRSYASNADNPWFLLKDNGNSYRSTDQNARLSIDLNTNNLQLLVNQSYQHIAERTLEKYKPGTTAWIDGMYTDRNKSDMNYLLQSQATYDIDDSYEFNAGLALYYTYNNAHTRIGYQPDNIRYDYQRSSHDIFLNFITDVPFDNGEVKIDIGNKAYFSNTATESNLFLPAVDARVTFTDLAPRLSMELSSSYHVVNSELPVNRSLAYTNLLQYTAQQASHYRPVTEVSGYKDLSPIRHKEWAAKVNLTYSDLFIFSGNVYIRNIRNDVFPLYRGGMLQLKNMADMQNKGLELSLQTFERSIGSTIRMESTLSFFTYRNKVTRVNDGYNYTPIAGFSNVHKSLIEGQPLGVIVGSTYVTDGAGHTVIGDDGFPLVDPQPQIIGNPIPDFVMKFNNTLRWKKLSLQTDLEWKKGAETWNGTQAALDYYGRSAGTAAQRNISNYVFDGVLQNGHVNDIPVSFYDARLPVESNRWTRYGLPGVASSYIQKADYLRLNAVNLTYRLNFKKNNQVVLLSTYVNNILLWSPYKGADPDQLLFDQTNTTGLDFFNLPAVKTYGFNVSYQF